MTTKAKATAKSKTTKAATTKRAKATANECMCGCGESAVRSFRAGHDGRLKGMLLRAFRGTEKLPARVVKLHGTDSPERIAKSRGWERFMVPSKAATR